MMSLGKDGSWAVDLFPVLQISGENPPHLISDGQRRTRAALIWQMSLSLAPIISRGQGMELKSLPESFMISRFPAHLK